MAFTYNTRVVVSGKQVEVYKYEKTIWRDFVRTRDSVVNSHEEPKQLDILERLKKQEIQRASSLNRTRREIKRLINSNPQLNKFLTLTFANSTTDLKEANYIFNKFILRMNYKYPNFEYLAVPEFQKDVDFYGRKKENGGSVHYHVLCNLPFVHYSELTQIWGQGNIDIKKVDDVTNLGAYVCKYLSKDMFDERTFNKKKFFRSQTLKTPVEILGWSAKKFIEKYLAESKPTYEITYDSERGGKVDYKSFVLDNYLTKRL